MKRIAAAAAVLILAAGLAAALVMIHADTNRIGELEQRVNAEASLYGDLSSKVASLNVPTDPLSAYTDVCNQQMTSQATGISQTYWFPCTNQAQTIPQPGN